MLCLRSPMEGFFLFLPICLVSIELKQKWHRIAAGMRNGQGKQEAERARNDGFAWAKQKVHSLLIRLRDGGAFLEHLSSSTGSSPHPNTDAAAGNCTC